MKPRAALLFRPSPFYSVKRLPLHSMMLMSSASPLFMLGDHHVVELTSACRNLGEAAEPPASWIGGAIHLVPDEICSLLEWEEDRKLLCGRICETLP